MDWLRAFHAFDFIRVPSPLIILVPNPFALWCLLLMFWSFGIAYRGHFSAAFRGAVRLTWAAFLLYGVSGVMLALSGQKVASAVAAAGKQVTKYGFAPQAKRNPEHWMYTAFVLLSLFAIEALMGKLLPERRATRVLPVVTLFMWGAALMIVRVAVLPSFG